MWADDVSDYVAQNLDLPDEEYPFSFYGVVRKPTNSSEEIESKHKVSSIDPQPNEMKEMANRKKSSAESQSNDVEKHDWTDKSFPIVPAPAKPGEAILPHTDISDKSKKIWIVTTAALPWMTGTAVNPLLRAAYLLDGRKEAGGSVVLHLPWIEQDEDQEKVFGKGKGFETQADQEKFIRDWIRDTAKMPQAADNLVIKWYIAWLQESENSLYAMGDITALIPTKEADIVILEEPEHLNWYRAPGEQWINKFKHVVGIVHTNYFVYAQEQPAAFIRAPSMRLLTSWMCRAHSHRIIKLSGTLSEFAPEKEITENVHGVRQSFLDIGEKVSLRCGENINDEVFGSSAKPTIYFIGKMLWSKGLGSLMELTKYAEESANLRIKIDMYGGGPDKNEAIEKVKDLGLDMVFHGPVDHALLGETQKIFINPSTSEVLCTTVLEALAMGKFVVLPSHPSNDFFAQFPNCLPYSSKEEFVGNLYYALTHSPEPLTKEYSYALSWEAATKRLESCGCITVAEAEAVENALSTDAGLELPPLIKNQSRRSKVAATIRLNRSRYRQFRSRLSQEVQQSNILPIPLQKRLVAELEKRLDFNIDEILSSPKLRVQLSPAELDKQVLDFYVDVAHGPYGDLFRVIGGGFSVGRQNLYLKQQARKLKRQQESVEFKNKFFGTSKKDSGYFVAPSNIRSALERNLNLTLKKTGNSQSIRNSFVGEKIDLFKPKGRQEDSGPRMFLQSQSVGMFKPRHHGSVTFPTLSSKIVSRPMYHPPLI